MRRARLLALLVLGVSAAAIAARRPEVFTTPQFYAEDGMEFFARAYNAPTPVQASVFFPYGGYLQVFPRLAGKVAGLFDLAAAPLVMAAFALLIQAAAPVFLLSERFAWAVPGRARRLVLAILLIAVPNLMEVHANITNSHVHLALLALLVLIAEPSRALAWRVFDVACLVVSGLSGPFCLLLVPAAALCWRSNRDPWTRTRFLIVLGTALVQFWVLSQWAVGSRAVRSAYGAAVANLLALLGAQIFVAGLVGVWNYASLYAGVFANHPWLPAVIGAVGLVFLARAAIVTTSTALRVLLLFAALHLAAALTSPIIFGDKPLWEMLKTPGAGQRYYFFTTLAYLATLLWTVAADPRLAMRGVAAVLLGVLALVGVPRDWRLPPQPDLHFAAQVERFQAARTGEKVELLITPEPWRMMLVKH